MEAKNEIFFVGSDVAALDGGTEIVHPPQTAALPAPEEASSLRESAPPTLSFFRDVLRQHLILLRRPRPSLQSHFAAARRRFIPL